MAITLRFPPALHNKLKVLAANRNMAMSEYLLTALTLEVQNAKRFDSIHKASQLSQPMRADAKTGWFPVSDDDAIHPRRVAG